MLYWLMRDVVVALAASLALVSGCDDPRDLAPGRDPCQRCHGGEVGNAAPPRTARGTTGTPSDPAVGAHQAHLHDGALRSAVGCGECHPVPASGWSHVDGDAGPIFGPLATAGGADLAAYDPGTGRCSGTYCHGSTLGAGGTNQAPLWTAGASEAACGTCHGYPPPPIHPQVTACQGCHPDTVRADGSIDVAGGRHVNGTLDIVGEFACGVCHPVPPDTGSHRAHYGDTSSPPLAGYGDLRILEDWAPGGGPVYAFGCGHCHPLDPARHGLGEVDLSPPPSATGSLKDRNDPAATYDPGTGTCSGVYCHSNGKGITVRVRTAPGVIEDVPPFRTTPAWTSGASPGCGGCHGNPPRYESGGPGAADANTHLQLDADGWETGHFGGLPGPWHTSKHGGGGGDPDQMASPITCQVCHHETADPTSTGPSGFYWLDTTGDYQLPGGVLGYACGSCHAPGDPVAPTGNGRVLPLRHVNGRPDVAFDPRVALPAGIAGLPAAPFTPTRPIWLTDANPGVPAPLDGVYEPEPMPPGTWPYTSPTLSMHLGSLAYDPATKTCTNASCHLAQTSVTWGGPTGWDTCGACHGF
jgi:predicted CxxxxCH...CXXCH cytochrome family protein